MRPAGSRSLLETHGSFSSGSNSLTDGNPSLNGQMKISNAAAAALLVFCSMVPAASAQTAADSSAIRQAALDYIQGWYAGDAARMERALHPELAKRIVRTDSLGHDWVAGMGASQLVAGTRAGGGREVPAAEQRTEVTVLDVFQDAAS